MTDFVSQSESASNIRLIQAGCIKPDPFLVHLTPEYFIGKYVKIGFGPETAREFMWVKVAQATQTACVGRLANDPHFIDHLENDDLVAFVPAQACAVQEDK
jgi:hypothetical protein